jgi:anti-sigma-K factor RskA
MDRFKDDPAQIALIKRYLLGDLHEKQQVEIEERAFQDPAYVALIQSIEIDLIDEYVRGGLSNHERRQFEARFFESAERRRKVEFAKNLAAIRTEFEEEEEN